MENHNVFAGAFVDRIGERRKDSAWLADALRSDDSCFVPVWGDQCLIGGDPLQAVLLKRDQVTASVADEDLIFLGLFRDRPAFAVPIAPATVAPFRELGEFHDLRYLGTVLPADEANLVAHARALVLWHASQVFCGVCGSSARPETAGNSRVCMNDECRREIFPRVDPAIIVLVSNGDRCLLGRQASWPEGRYSQSPASSSREKAWKTQCDAKCTRKRTSGPGRSRTTARSRGRFHRHSCWVLWPRRTHLTSH